MKTFLLGTSAAALFVFHGVTATCPNRCSGHGSCNYQSTCECWDGFEGGDCALFQCPKGAAWQDQATGVDEAHAEAECSNRGVCDRSKGSCGCQDGFTGRACQYTSCPSDCNNNGVCMSLSKFASEMYDANSDRYTYDSVWDATKMHGCYCDYGYSGYDCSLRDCPDGDDPLTTGQSNEVQLVQCTATGGEFALYYEGAVSSTISADDTASAVEAALEEIRDISDVTVTFSYDGATACESSVINIMVVTFTQNFGSLSPLVAYTDDLDTGGTIKISADGSTSITDSNSVSYTSVKGDKESESCSNRGLCDTTTGICTCYTTNSDTYVSSDGAGGQGTRGDCGCDYTTIANCPGEVSCSGHGVCDDSSGTYRCDCSDGWTSGDCSERSCESGLSWFSYPTEDELSHNTFAECSDGGICDRGTGTCTCSDSYYGGACEYMVCGGGTGNPCNGHGACISMAQLALVAEDNGDATDYTFGSDPNEASTWDAHRIYGCLCDSGWDEYDCSLRTCPHGDDPNTYGQSNEVQLLECTATSGTFDLTFRQQTYSSIPFNVTASTLEAGLEALSSITDVSVVYNSTSDDGTLCTSQSDENIIYITFNTEHGDVPDITYDTSSLVDDGNGGTAGTGTISLATDGATNGVHTSVLGDTEDIVCSGRGECDRSSGVCACYSGYSGSDGLGSEGNLGDCGFRMNDRTKSAA